MKQESLLYHLVTALAIISVVLIVVGAMRDLSKPQQIPPKPSPTQQPRAASARCYNGDPPREWTRLDKEAHIHKAQMSLRTAEKFGVWTDLGNRWAILSIGQWLEILVCGGEK